MKFSKLLIVTIIIITCLTFSSHAASEKYQDRTLLKASGPAVYIVMNSKASWIPSEFVFNCMKLGWNSILTIPDSELGQIEKAPLLVKGSGPKVYKVESDERRWIVSEDVFKN